MLALVCALAAAAPVVNHAIEVTLDPAAGTLSVSDTLTLPSATATADFVLHAGLTVSASDATAVVAAQDVKGFAVPAQHVHVELKSAGTRVTLKYAGKIVHAPEQVASESQRTFQETPGTIDARGVYLARDALWFPRLLDEQRRPLDELVTAKLTVRGLPAGWSALSEGDESDDAWVIAVPSDDLHVVAAPFAIKQREKARGVDVLVWLRTDKPADKALAARYLEVTGQYLALYEELLGPYPYTKFALVENFWETGYGMPSFTLLGPQVVRFPFILHSSYPHELLHNWWGNGVFVDYAHGNWCEGLTAYLADHMNAEMSGKGDEYRRTTLERYRDFVASGADFPLVDFTNRSSASTEAVGYGKTAMVFHMLRRHLGDAKFVEALRRFYRHHKFDRASWADVSAAFAAQDPSTAAFIAAWTTRTGAPEINWTSTQEKRSATGARTLEVTLAQTQRDAPFPVEVPVVVTLANGKAATGVAAFDGTSRTGVARIPLADRAVRVDIDPFFDTFRALLPGETAPALSRTLGAKNVLYVLPTLASKEEKDGWARFAKGTCGDGAVCTSVTDDKVSELPRDSAVWILGYGNRLRAAAVTVGEYGARFEDRGFIAPGGKREDRVDPGKTAVALALAHPKDVRLGMVFVGAPGAYAIDPLTRKLPHYGKYGYLTFTGEAVENQIKGSWANTSSPLTVFPTAEKAALAMKAGGPLRQLPPPFDATRMVAAVNKLADPSMEGRGPQSKGLEKALAFVESELKDAGLTPGRQCDASFGCNVIATIAGADAALAPVVLGAHVDHLGKDAKKAFLGADDNASGVAVLLEVARALARTGAGVRTIHLVAFSGEEKGLLGSRFYVKSLGDKKAFAMVNLDTVGRKGEKPLLVLDGDSASEWVHIVRGVGFTTQVKAELAAQGGGSSDQVAFREAGVPAIQIFSGVNADYHRVTDSADKVEPASLVDAAVLARETVAYLAERKEPLTVKGAVSAPSGEQRRASLGTMPDMTFAGPGVKIDGAVPGSPGEKLGLQKGDVLVRFDNKPVLDLKTYSELLKSKKPGDKVQIVVERAGKPLTFDVELGAR